MPKTVPLVPMKTKIKEIQSVYTSAADQVVSILSGLDPANFTAVDSGRALSRVRDIVRMLDTSVKLWAPNAIKAAYNESRDVASTRLELIGAKKSRRFDMARNDRTQDALTKKVLTDFFKANKTIEGTAKRFLAVVALAAKKTVAAKLQAFDSKVIKGWINDVIGESVDLRESRSSVYKTIKDKLLAQLKGKDFIRINGRSYNLRDYAELVAGVRMREAATEATLNSAAEYNHDLVEIPASLDPCDICADIQGKVYSVSGNDPDYPKLTDEETPPIHPRCRHYLRVVSRETLARRAA